MRTYSPPFYFIYHHKINKLVHSVYCVVLTCLYFHHKHSIAYCRAGEVRLVVSDDAETFYMGTTNYDSSYYDKNGLRVGRVEICVGGRYGTICMDFWDNMDASVVCTQMGFSRYGKECVCVCVW